MTTSSNEAKTPLESLNPASYEDYPAGELAEYVANLEAVQRRAEQVYQLRTELHFGDRATLYSAIVRLGLALKTANGQRAKSSEASHNPERDQHSLASQTDSVSSSDISSTLAEIKERRKRVTIGKWWGWYVEDGKDKRVYRNDDQSGVCKPTHPSIGQRFFDAEFIANAPTDIDTLLGIVNSLIAAWPTGEYPLPTELESIQLKDEDQNES